MLTSIKKIVKTIIQHDERKVRRIAQGANLRLDPRLNAVGVGLLYEVYVLREYAQYFPFSAPPVTIVDIGAHFGYFSLFAAQHAHPQSRIIAIEPSPQNAAILRQNINNNAFRNITLLECGVGGSNETQRLYLSRSENHSIIPSYNTQSQQSIPVRVQTLPTIMQEQGIGHIDFLKMDCEGAEYPILLQLPAQTWAAIDTIVMEFHDLTTEGWTALQLIERLRAHGYAILRFQYDPCGNFGNKNFGKIVASRKYGT